ncbi:AAA family ATPase [Virgibacillus sp. AGTR]|uniref:UvrD-helicase domain-containing protein n=1 Tax=Virgibacillus sp. AGTR TaxID=2812055 RepID=UPI001D168E54|nr:UvrD-helicase domain-containing protein [Virgibacillus sp. AGTR]MCC2248957.1 AAA family ATPase [Virgibacillus sp. AGTR]
MPITIDTTSDNLNEQIQQVNNSIALNKQVDAKYFSKNMTGNGKRKTGLFSVDNDTINTFIKESRRLLGNVALNEAAYKNMDRHEQQTFGNFFHQSTKEKETEFKKFENNLTTMVPPIMLLPILSARTPAALSFPKNIGMYNLNALETTWEKITSGTIDGKPATTYAKPVVQSMRLYSREKKHQLKSGHVSTESQVSGQPDIYVLFATVLDNMDKDGDMIFANERINGGRSVTRNQGVVTLTRLEEKSITQYNYTKLNEQLSDHLGKVIGNTQVNIPGITDHQLSLVIGDQSMSDLMKSQAMTITHQAKETLLTFVKAFAARMKELQNKKIKYPSVQKQLNNALITFVQHIDLLNDIEDNLITTDLLASIYQTLKENLGDQRTINNIARHSLRLLLSQRLHELEEIRDSNGLYQFDPKDQQVSQAMQQNPNYSTQQKRIVTTTDPLVIGQAGAGSGKSHTLIGRINYLKDQGENLSKVLVLSFTNVAAINITNRFPGVRSETLANMFHTIYSATYPAQSLSQPSTVANSIRLLNPASQYFQDMGLDAAELKEFIDNFAMRLEQFDQTGFKRVNLQQELKRLSNLVEGNLDMCAHVLDAVEQTTLELEPIIIHHKLLQGGDDLNIPDAYQNLNYIITDESQDISTFEYILLLELTIHYRSQLLIIGDGSQTLYEFRNSDPRYMNALEASNVFTSHKLETNYRSNEEILMFANQFLQVIDANKYANIQLKSSNFSSPTEQSVRDTITIGNNEIESSTLKDYTEGLKNYLQHDDDFKKWFIDRVKKGEQVAIMGWTRKEVVEAGEVIEAMLKDHQLGHIEITNIMSNNERPMTLLSRFARAKAETLRSLDPTHQHYLQEIERHADQFVHKNFKRSSGKQTTFYYDFIMRNIKTVVQSNEWNAWIIDYRKGNINKHQIGSFLIQQLLRLETRKNAMDQFLRKQKDVPNYDQCPIILSTIHGTKGLEFDHTVVLFNEAKRGATSQESMRMMFVALSRAKKSEYIINSHRASKMRSVSDTHASMFQTPISSAYLRTLNDVKKTNQAQPEVATP